MINDVNNDFDEFNGGRNIKQIKNNWSTINRGYREWDDVVHCVCDASTLTTFGSKQSKNLVPRVLLRLYQNNFLGYSNFSCSESGTIDGTRYLFVELY